MSNRLLAHPGAVIALVLLWKTALFTLFLLPVPSNDSFFYDGPVVNWLLGGNYANPSLALALPISGKELFTAYPPLYQFVLAGWMWLFGTSVVAAMGMHLLLFALYGGLLLAVFRRLTIPAWAGHVGALFLLTLTFHDRPDSLAHVFGLGAVYCWVRSLNLSTVATTTDSASNSSSRLWPWGMAFLAICTFATGFQIGVVYALVLVLGTVLARAACHEKLPWGAMVALILAPPLLLVLVATGFPRLWEGFLEHAHQTSSLRGWRVPEPAEVLKLLRNGSGVLAAGCMLAWLLWRRFRTRERFASGSANLRLWTVMIATTAAALAMACAAMVLLTPNSVFFAIYLQPLIVAGCLVLVAEAFPLAKTRRWAIALFLALAAVGAIRAIGLSTWGVACALNVGYPASLEIIRRELASLESSRTVVVSSAYLYEVGRHRQIQVVHSDWLAPAQRGNPDADWEALLRVKPARLLLTQFDLCRRYEPLLQRLAQRPDLASFSVENTARLPAPDSIPALRRVVQHLSWAPVVVKLEWRPSPPR